MKAGKKTLIRLKRDGLEIGQWGVKGHRTIPFENIKDLNYAPQGFEAGPTTGQQVAIGVLLPFAFPLAILGYALAKGRKEPMLAISYRLGGNVTAHALFGGKQAGELYQELLRRLAAK